MKAILNRNCGFEIVTHLDRNGDPVFETEIFAKGQQITFELIDHPLKLINGEWTPDESFWNIQFDNGSMAMAVSREWLDLVD